ncbi:MAG: hypothetical protein DRP42_07760 [Tenericutes bacterium]|nr:MAG: hypothetical protein DRP42_07760 [Mycoplasmatota bacterium]
MNQGWVVFKAGDQKGGGGWKHLSTREGMIVTYVDGFDDLFKDLTEDEIFSDHMKTVYAIGRIPRSFIPVLQDALEPVGGDDISDPGYRKNKKYIPFNKLAIALGDATLIQKWRGSSIVPIQDMSSLTASDFEDIFNININVDIPDNNSVSSGTYSAGVGKTYLDWESCLSDIANLSNALKFEQQAGITCTAGGTMTESLNGNTLTFTSNAEHNGIFTADGGSGWKTQVNTNAIIFRMTQEGAGITIIEKLEFVTSTATASEFIGFDSVITEFTAKCRDLLFDCGGVRDYAIDMNDDDVNYELSNIVCKEPDLRFINLRNASSGKMLAENITVIDSDDDGILTTSSAVYSNFRNTVCARSAVDDFGGNFTNATMNTCASTDDTADDAGSGSGNVINIADNFVDEYKIDATSDLYGVGSAPVISGHTHYINGVVIDQGAGNYDIGAWGVLRGSTGNPWWYYKMLNRRKK